jgi:hypothetical protein
MVGVCLTIPPMVWLHGRSDVPPPDPVRYAQEQCARQLHGQTPLPLPPIEEGEGIDVPPGDEEKDTSQPYNPDWCDLAAQQQSAQSAVGMEKAALWTVALTAVGLIMVGGTLYYTVRAVHISREIGQAQVRAYLSVALFTLCWTMGSAPLWGVVIRNTGWIPVRSATPQANRISTSLPSSDRNASTGDL